ncbi:MAG TPA: DUF2254 domain-containing protein [Arachnia sp.]|nr:DUF2254 domain-containing protein [Arachnia sp.]
MGRLRSWLAGIPSRFWFIPALFIAAAIVLAQVLVSVDRAQLPLPAVIADFLFDTGVDGARALLTAVASFLGVAGTAFSITISVISTASTTYGPRLVRNFMRDRNNQIVLGVLVATFVYTLMVLRTIRSESDDGAAFVPHLAVNGAIALGVVDVFLFVWFINHIASSVQIEALVKGARDDFARAVKGNWLDPDDKHVDHFDPPREGGGVATLGRSGYITRIDARNLADDITETATSVRLLKRIGDQVMADEPLALVWPVEAVEVVLPKIRDHVHVGPSRSTDQDVRFAEQQVVELAVRALSPGTNDPYTAINAVEEVAAGVLTAVARSDTGTILVDDDGAPRLYLRPVRAAEIVDMPFEHLRPYALNTRIVLEALVDLAARIRVAAVDPEVAARADTHVDSLVKEAAAHLTAPDLALLTEHVATSRLESVTQPPAQP